MDVSITVRTHSEAERICITVRDDGVGMDEAQTAFFRELLSEGQDNAKNIGIRNVARRLQLHFEGQCKFRVESKPGSGTTIELRLPMINGEKPV